MIFSKQETSNTIGVYDRTDVKVFIHCATDTIVDHSFDIQHDGHWFLYCLAKKGGLYRVEKGCEEQSARQTASNEDDQTEIFSDLLGRQDDSVDVFQLCMSTQPVYILNDSDVVGKKHENPVALCVCSNQIVIVTETSTEYTIFIYRKANMHADKSTARLPKNAVTEKKAKFSESVLVKVLICDTINSYGSTSSDILKLDATLFKQLFGEDTVLLKSPIILIGQPDGSVHFIPMSSFVPSSSLDNMPMPLRSKHYKGSWSLLCQMSLSVREITSVTLVKGDGQTYDCCDTVLCIFGHDGQVIIFWSVNGNPDYIVSEDFICSPVLSVRSFHNKLYYSNGYSLFESAIDVHSNYSHLPRNRQLQISKTKVLNDRYVTEIHEISADGYVGTQASPCTVHCSCLNGQLVVIEASSWSNLICDTRISKKETLKDILTSIDEVGRKRQELKKKTEVQDENMEQLSIAAYLMAAYARQKNVCLSDKGENKEERVQEEISPLYSNIPISVVYDAKAQMNGKNEVFEMSVEITNQMAVTLSSDWTFSASVVSTYDVEIATSSVKVNKEWKKNEKFILSLPVSFQQILSKCKLIIKAVVLTGNNVTTGDGKRDRTQKRQLSVPIYEKDIDVLDCLLPVSETSLLNENISKWSSNTMMKDQAKNRIPNLKLPGVSEDIGDITVCTRDVFHISSTALGGHGQERAARHLLELLFGKTISDCNGMKPSDFQLVTAFGHVVQLSILPCKPDKTANRDDGYTVNEMEDTLEVIVRASPRIAAAVHRAISCRQQQILSSLGKRFVPTTSTQYARKSIQTAQDTMNQINGNGQNETTFAFAFQKIRNIHF
ncbi:uncharacterized protein LOC123553304 [Mercenaria mercenaria]|uniref:uncharacterized protein LOC123553304 n=1 Tax=Mercenaria mercenaria TaxID=6596 RepID=UPI00234F862B|nr:uncharacterized protein LOC123553304 [Mercenaria mercenaria]